MPERHLSAGDILVLERVKKPSPAKAIQRSLRPHVGSLHRQGQVALHFDWDCFEVFISITEEGLARLERDRLRRLTAL